MPMSSRQPGAPVRRLQVEPGQLEPGRWPYTLPAVRHLVEEGMELDPGVTVLVGPNGSGKSTVVEALAAAWARRVTVFRDDWLQRAMAEPSAEDSDLDRSLRLEFTRGGPTGGMFLRAERLHEQAGLFEQRGRWAPRMDGTPVLARSHGEGFLQVLTAMSVEPGLYLMDEPESALSFDSCLVLLALLGQMRDAGSQVVVATHSPVLAAVPGARILQFGEEGITQVEYDDSDLVVSWRSFLDAPERYLRHLS